MSRRGFFWTALTCVAVLFVAVNALAGVLLRGARVDLTENRLYTLSDATVETIRSFDEPVDVTLFFSRRLAQHYPSHRDHGARVREMLQTYADRSGGRINLEVVDPVAYSAAEDRAIAAGVQGVPTEDGEPLYLGVHMRDAVDSRLTIPLLSPDQGPFLEYELTRALADLDAPAAPRVGLISALPLAAGPGGNPFSPNAQPYRAYEQLSAAFDLVDIDDDFETIPEGVDILFIAHPPALSDRQLYAIDQWTLAHGRVLALVDPYSRMAMTPGAFGYRAPGARAASDLGPLLAAWGVDYDPTEAVLDAERGLRVYMEEGGRLLQRVHPAMLRISLDQLDREDLATAVLRRGLNLAVAGSFHPRPGAEERFYPLAITSLEVDGFDAMRAEGDPLPSTLMGGFVSEGRARVVIARISGRIETAFPDGPPAAEAEEGEESEAPAAPGPAPAADVPPDPQLAEGRAEIVLVADADLLDDAIYMGLDPETGALIEDADNAVFVLNALDNLAGSDALVALRARAPAPRSMTRVDDMLAAAQRRYDAEQQRLELELAAAEARLAELETAARLSGIAPGDASLSVAARAERESARQTLAEARARLRAVQRSFRADIDRLRTLVIILNVWLAPLLAAAAGVWVFFARRRAHGVSGGRR